MLVNIFPCPAKNTKSERYFCESNKGESHTAIDQTLVSYLSVICFSVEHF